MEESGSGVGDGHETPLQLRMNIVLALSRRVLSKHFSFLVVIWAVNYAFELWWIDGFLHAVENAMLHQGISFAPIMFRFGLVCLAGALSSALIGLVTFQCLREEPVRLGESLYRVISHIVPLVLTAVAVIVITLAGMILLIIPGVIALVAFSVALPACLVEKLGPFASLSRSVALTKIHFWSIFVVFAAFMVISTAFGSVLGSVLGPMLRQPGHAFVYFAAQSVLSVVLYGFLQLAFAVIYYVLRISKEGTVVG